MKKAVRNAIRADIVSVERNAKENVRLSLASRRSNKKDMCLINSLR